MPFEEMKVYIADIEALEDSEKFETVYRFVDAARRSKVDKYRFQKDKMLSLGVGALLHEALRDAGISEAKVAQTPTGKPYLENDDKWFFSLSHSGSKVLCATAEVPIGCDIEEMNSQSLQIMDRVLAPEEQKLFTDQSPDEQRDLFYMLWTGKESYLKLTGEGIVENLRESSIRVPFGSQIIRGRTVTFIEIPCGGDYKAAVCAEGIHESGELQIRSVHF